MIKISLQFKKQTVKMYDLKPKKPVNKPKKKHNQEDSQIPPPPRRITGNTGPLGE